MARRTTEKASAKTAQAAARYQKLRLALDAVSALALLLTAAVAVIRILHG